MRSPVPVILLSGYFLLLVYASLMPFDMVLDENLAARNFRVGLEFWPFGDRHSSKTDLGSNFLLYIPLGLMAGTLLRSRGWSIVSSLFLGSLAAIATSVGVECCQLFSPTRTAGAQDLLMNAAGGVFGAVLAVRCGQKWWRGLKRESLAMVRDRPALLAATILMALLAAESFYPFMPTLTVSDVGRALRRSCFSLSRGLAVNPWHGWVAERIGPYAVLTALLGARSVITGKARRLQGAALAIVFAAGTELGKVFIEARVINVANVFMSACGVAAGVVGGCLFSGRLSARGRRAWGALALVAYITYLELAPFTFAWDQGVARNKIPAGMEWAPLYHYALGARPGDVWAFVRTIVLLAWLTCLVARPGPVDDARLGRARRVLAAGLAAGLFGLVLESAQFLLAERTPSITDISCFALGGVCGMLILQAISQRQERAAVENGLGP